MWSSKQSVNAECREIKQIVTDALVDAMLTQDALAGDVGEKQGTISRWLDFDGICQVPAVVAVSARESVRLPLLRHLVKKNGLVLASQLPVLGSVNGDLSDESLRMHALIVHLQEQFTNRAISKGKLLKLAEQLHKTVDAVDAEIEARP